MTYKRGQNREYRRIHDLPVRERMDAHDNWVRDALDDQSVDDIVRELVDRRDEDDPPDCIFLRGDE